jgi:hypothetical protein
MAGMAINNMGFYYNTKKPTQLFMTKMVGKNNKFHLFCGFSN